ncbi:MAG: metalloregulator ArsR/SmtB family transcription factor [Propionibacteriaceae bacterium]|nr:metalloregulator ArsR/SmtB family transcription factor [Propionibacteriaceae bacterium]
MTIEIPPQCGVVQLVMLDHGEAVSLATMLKAMADPVRLCLLHYIAEQPETTVCACHLPAALGISQPTLSHHLKKLTDAHLITRTQHGRWARYHVNRSTLDSLGATLDTLVASPPAETAGSKRRTTR